eukprot:SAG31_NODE_3756_length_3912_cov_99.932074_4_plen_189_part_00
MADAAPVEQNDVADTSPKSSAAAGIDEAVETGAVGREEEDAWSDRDNGGRTPSEDDAEVEVGESVIDAAAATTEEAEVEPVQSVLEAATTAQSEPAEASLDDDMECINKLDHGAQNTSDIGSELAKLGAVGDISENSTEAGGPSGDAGPANDSAGLVGCTMVRLTHPCSNARRQTDLPTPAASAGANT